MGSARYVYAIVGRDTPLPTAGIEGVAELAMVPCGALAAVTGRMADDSAPVTVEAVLHHEAVVEAVRRQGPALPVRFGTLFRDAAAVASAIADRYGTLAADLERLGDKVELGLTALWAAPGAPAPAPPEEGVPAGQSEGAHYLRARVAELRRDEALQDRARTVARELDEALGGLALDRRVSLLPTPRIAVRAAYLLDPAAVRGFRAAAETVRGTGETLRILLSGPWPPYSFVGRTNAEGADRLTSVVQLLTDAMHTRLG